MIRGWVYDGPDKTGFDGGVGYQGTYREAASDDGRMVRPHGKNIVDEDWFGIRCNRCRFEHSGRRVQLAGLAHLARVSNLQSIGIDKMPSVGASAIVGHYSHDRPHRWNIDRERAIDDGLREPHSEVW